jgi:hypothetical protein
MNVKYFLGACFLVFMALLKYGAPVPALIAGLGLAFFVTWKMQRRQATPDSKDRGVRAGRK